MTLNETVETRAHELEAERRALLAQLAAVEASIDALEARCGFHPTIADARIDLDDVRARLLALGAGRVTVH